MSEHVALPLDIAPAELLGGMEADGADPPFAGATWYVAQAVGDGLAYSLPAGALVSARYLTADFLADGAHLPVFTLALKEGDDGPEFQLKFALQNQCQARLRLPLGALDQNKWLLGREAGLLKPTCRGRRVDPARVDHMTLTVLRKSEEPVRVCMTAITATADEPPLLTEPILPQGKLLDKLGQSTVHTWPTRTESAEALIERLREQQAAAAGCAWPSDFSRWGGWQAKRFDSTGFFRTQHDGSRWWLIDPDGHPFWSAGLDCVESAIQTAYTGLETAMEWMPERDGRFAAAFSEDERFGRMFNYLGANFIRAFGPDEWHERWAEIALSELRRVGFNTVANWSEWEIARDAGIPYVRPLGSEFGSTPKIYRDFPDVYHPGFEKDVAEFAAPLRDTADDPALIGYFLMNEPKWGFARETPAEGMLYTCDGGPCRAALAGFLQRRHGDDAGLRAAWGMEASLGDVAGQRWTSPLADGARADLEEFSTVMVSRFFAALSAACRAVDPNHLNLGVRYAHVPPEWALAGMKGFDVFSMNCYRARLPAEDGEQLERELGVPVMVGEWHFGALDAGLPASGIARVRTQADRGRAYRVYLEDAAAKPWCVGVHYFTLYDESALGRSDGENYQMGFLDVCNRPYEPIAAAARASHERMYRVAAGETAPFDDEPEYLPAKAKPSTPETAVF